MTSQRITHVAYFRDRAIVESNGALYTTKEPERPNHKSQRYLCKDTARNKLRLRGYGAKAYGNDVLDWLDRGRRNAKMLNLDCSKCGACCQAKAIDGCTYVINIDSKIEVNRIHAIDPASIDTKTGYIKFKDGACPFWKGVVGESSQCSIYNQRPCVCYSFPKGNGVCLRMRRSILPALGLGHLISEAEKTIEIEMPTYKEAKAHD